MSNFQKSKHFMKKGLKFRHSEHYGLVHQKNHLKIVMTKFKYFLGKKWQGKNVHPKLLFYIQNPNNFSHVFL
jgi:hypothetical protein